MEADKKEFFEIADDQFKKDYIVSDITTRDHWLLVGIGIVPFVIATIWHVVTF